MNKNNDMGTPRPTIDVENSTENNKKWPDGANLNYDIGARFAFRIGKIDGNWWHWPWPEWIGLPTREELPHWLKLVQGWKLFLMKPEEIEQVNEAMARAVKSL